MDPSISNLARMSCTEQVVTGKTLGRVFRSITRYLSSLTFCFLFLFSETANYLFKLLAACFFLATFDEIAV
jgi:hypothetical protein